MTELGCSSEHTVELFKAMGEKAAWCRVFAQEQSWSTTATPYKTAIAAHQRGERVALSFKADPKAVASGAQDGRIRGIADGLKAAGLGNGILIFYHEPEDNIANGEFTAAEWRAAQDRYREVAKPILAPIGWRFAPCLMGWTLDPRSGRNVEDYWVPGCDLYTWDSYNMAGAGDPPDPPYATKDPSTVDPLKVYGPPAAWARSKGRGSAICETGVARRQADTAGAERTKFMAAVTASKVLEAYEFVCYYENGIADKRAEFAIRAEAPSRAQFSAWRTAAVPEPEPEPGPEPVPEDPCAALKVELAATKADLTAALEHASAAAADRDALLAKISAARHALE